MQDKFLGYLVSVLIQLGATSFVIPAMFLLRGKLNDESKEVILKLMQVGVFLLASGFGILILSKL